MFRFLSFIVTALLLISPVFAQSTPSTFFDDESNRLLGRADFLPATAPASAFGILNSTDGNAVIAVDAYYTILYGLFLAAKGDTEENLYVESHSGQWIALFNQVLNQKFGYQNEVIALSQTPFDEKWTSEYGEVGVRFISGGNISEEVDAFNTLVAKEIGVQRMIERVPRNPSDVLFRSVVKQSTAWGTQMIGRKIKWEGDQEVNGWIGSVPVLKEKTEYDVTIYHIKMADNVTMSVAFCDDIENHSGEWLYSQIAHGSLIDSGSPIVHKAVVAGPNVEIETDLDFKNIEPLSFIFDDRARFTFAKDSILHVCDARQKTRLTLDQTGLDAKAATAVVASAKGFGPKIPEPDLVLDRPFYAVWSYEGPDGILMPTLAARVVTPAR